MADLEFRDLYGPPSLRRRLAQRFIVVPIAALAAGVTCGGTLSMKSVVSAPAGCTAISLTNPGCSFTTKTAAIEVAGTGLFWQVTVVSNGFLFVCARGEDGAEVATCFASPGDTIGVAAFGGSVASARDLPVFP